MSLEVILIALLGMVIAAGLVLLVDALTPKEPSPVASSSSSAVVTFVKGQSKRVIAGAAAALLTLVATRWIVAAVAVGAVVLLWDKLVGGGREERQGIAKVEGLAAWTESLRDTVAGAVGLEQAIPSTAYAAAPAISLPLQNLSDRLRVRMPLPDALKRFADEIDDASADLIIAALILNARLRGPGLREVLSSLASSARAELEMRQRVNAGRASTRRSVQIIIGVSLLFVVGLAVFNPDYVAPYGTFFGQVVLACILGVFTAGVLWLRRLAKFDAPERFLQFRAEPGGVR